MSGAWHDIHIAITTPAMATKRKVSYTGTTNLQAIEVAENTSKESDAMSACEYGNNHDEHAVALLKDGKIVRSLTSHNLARFTVLSKVWWSQRLQGHREAKIR